MTKTLITICAAVSGGMEIIMEQLTETTLLQTEFIASEVADVFEDTKIFTEQLALHREVKEYLAEVNTRKDIKEHPLYWNVRETLVGVKESSGIYSTVWIANDRGNFYFDDIGNFSDESYDAKKRPWYEPAVNTHEVAFTKPYLEWSTGDTVMSAIKALRKTSEVYGFVAVDVTLESIPEIFDNRYLGYEGQFYLISEEGQYVYHPDDSVRMEKWITQEDDVLYPYREEIFKGEKKFCELDIDGESVLMISYPVHLANWRVVAFVQEDVLFSQMRGTFLTVFIVVLLALLVMLLSVRVAVKSQTKLFGLLVTYGNDITEGAFDKDIPSEYLEREDEVGKLFQSFQKIIVAFRNEKTNFDEKIESKNRELKQQYEYILETEKAASTGGLVAGIAHEINTPLGNSVTSLSYLLSINDKIRDKLIKGSLNREDLVAYFNEVDKSLQLVEGNLNRSVELVDNFKKVSVQQEGETKELVNLKGIISMVSVSLKHDIKQGKHKFKNNCPDGFEFRSYPGALVQIFTNLILNSLNHGFKNRENGVMDVEALKKDNQVTIIYKDNGLGMSMESVKNIYEPFYTTARNKGNVGLGMSIVFNLVNQKLGGTIRVTSSENRGITVLIQIPIEK